MNPLRLRLRNFRCYGELDLEFPDGLTSILGEIRDGDEGVESNGAGKSTIALAVDVALFGPEGRESLAQYQTHGSEGMLVELEFEHRGEAYRVRRAVSPKGKASVDFERGSAEDDGPWEWTIACNAASIKDTDAEIEQTLGMTRATFRASSLLLQGMVAFPELEPRDRADLLGRMLGLERWAKRQVAVRTEKAQVEVKRGWLDQELRTANEQLANLSTVRALVHRSEQDQLAAHARLLKAEADKGTIDAQMVGMERQASERAVAIANLETARSRLAPLEQRATAAQEAADKLPGLGGEIAGLDELVQRFSEITARNQTISQQQADWERMNAERGRLLEESEKGWERAEELRQQAARIEVGEDTCDRCGQTLGIEAAKKLEASLLAEAATLQAKADQADLRIRDIPASVVKPALEPMLDEVAAAPAALGAAQERLRQVLDVVEQAPAALSALAEARKAVVDADEALAKLPAPADSDLAVLRDARATAIAAVDQAKQAHARVQELHTRAKVDLERLEELDRTTAEKRRERDELLAELDVLSTLDRAYGREGLPARYLETVALPHIEAAATRILARLGAGCRVRFNTVRETKSGTSKDELFVEIVWDNGDVQEYRHFSGGEKTRIAVSIALALAEFLAGRDRASDLLVVDEPQYLDGAGMEALVLVLRQLNKRVAKVMLVAHDPRLAEAFDQSIRVIREGGRSRVGGAAAVTASAPLGFLADERDASAASISEEAA